MNLIFTAENSDRNNIVAFDQAPTNEVDMGDFKRVKSDALQATLIGHMFTERIMANGADLSEVKIFKKMHDFGVHVESSIMAEMLQTKYAKREEIRKSMGEETKVTFRYGEKKFAFFSKADFNGNPTGKMTSDFEEDTWQHY